MDKNEMVKSYTAYQKLVEFLDKYCRDLGEEFDILTVIDYEQDCFTVGLKTYPTKYNRSDYNELEIDLDLL